LKGFDIGIAAKGGWMEKKVGIDCAYLGTLEADVRKWVCREEESGCGLRVELVGPIGGRYYRYIQ
jgi:hypothetical protein